MQVPTLVQRLVDAGIDVTFGKNEKLGYYWDLNLMAKSHMYLYQKGHQWFIDMRYDVTLQIGNEQDLFRAAIDGMHGRDYINYKWADLLREEGYLANC